LVVRTTVYHISASLMRVFTETPQAREMVPSRPKHEIGGYIKLIKARADTSEDGHAVLWWRW